MRRSLSQAVRAVLHGNLGNLDAPVRLSQPVGNSNSNSLSSSSSSSNNSMDGRNGNVHGEASGTDGTGRAVGVGTVVGTGGAVGLGAWTNCTSGGGGRLQTEGGSTAGEGVRETSGEAGDGEGGVARQNGGRGGGGTGGRRRVRRAREPGEEAKAEELLRLEFARAMADMLYGFTECLFFLHPERPIFNGARFLQVRRGRVGGGILLSSALWGFWWGEGVVQGLGRELCYVFWWYTY